ncbi:hypothetical protein N7470_005022 [Penicillium chermesinum]|nr:hypothetical protein N7470_005022 [Penicillium chermesinum]
MARLLSVFSILSALSFTVAAPSPSKLHAITLGYRDIFELSTHQSKRAGQFTLPPLPFAYDALRPIIETEIMRIHHDKHHKNYVTNLNAALANQTAAIETKNIPTLVELQEKVRFNGGGHINHSLFWKSLAPYGSKATDITISAPSLRAAIEKQGGSLPSFMNDFNNTLMNIEGAAGDG